MGRSECPISRWVRLDETNRMSPVPNAWPLRSPFYSAKYAQIVWQIFLVLEMAVFGHVGFVSKRGNQLWRSSSVFRADYQIFFQIWSAINKKKRKWKKTCEKTVLFCTMCMHSIILRNSFSLVVKHNVHWYIIIFRKRKFFQFFIRLTRWATCCRITWANGPWGYMGHVRTINVIFSSVPF